MAAPIQLGTAYETLHGPNPGHYHFTAGLIAYPDGLFPDPLALEYSPFFEPFSLEFGPYYFNDNEAETLFLLDCPIIYRILVLAREPNRLSRVDPRHLAALFTAALTVFVSPSTSFHHKQVQFELPFSKLILSPTRTAKRLCRPFFSWCSIHCLQRI